METFRFSLPTLAPPGYQDQPDDKRVSIPGRASILFSDVAYVWTADDVEVALVTMRYNPGGSFQLEGDEALRFLREWSEWREIKAAETGHEHNNPADVFDDLRADLDRHRAELIDAGWRDWES